MIQSLKSLKIIENEDTDYHNQWVIHRQKYSALKPAMVHEGGFVCNAKEDFEHAEMDKQCFGMPFLTVSTWGTVVTCAQLLTI